jgi:hypothetical protein
MTDEQDSRRDSRPRNRRGKQPAKLACDYDDPAAIEEMRGAMNDVFFRRPGKINSKES